MNVHSLDQKLTEGEWIKTDTCMLWYKILLIALKALELEIPLQDLILIQMVIEKLDTISRHDWHQQNANQSNQSLENLLSFLETKS
jgi:hypothetical protein